MSLVRQGLTAVVITGAVGCAEPNPPLPPPVEVLVVANSTGADLSVAFISSSDPAQLLAVGGTGLVSGVAAFGPVAVAPLPDDDAAALVDLSLGMVVRTVPLPAGSGATGVAVLTDSVAYVANPNLNSITQINLQTGITEDVAVGVYPQGLISTRGSLFVINGNLAPCPQGLCPQGPSWLTVINPVTNRRADETDSIPLIGPGNAKYATLGSDGLLYVMNRGSAGDSRLSIVDPVGRQEIASFGGFGSDPGQLASDLGDRVFISSRTEGVMVFDTRSRTVVRGAGNGVAVPQNSGITADAQDRVYAIQSGDCIGTPGIASVLDSALALIRTIGLGSCSTEAVVTRFSP